MCRARLIINAPVPCEWATNIFLNLKTDYSHPSQNPPIGSSDRCSLCLRQEPHLAENSRW
jgi:hypothetical protein